MKERDLRIDVLKGIGILCVVWGHACRLLGHEIYIFHMPLFFFLSGMFFRDRWNFIPKRFLSLIVPYAFYTLAFSLLFHLQGGAWERPLHRLSIWFPSAVVGPSWFLIALFNISVVYYLLNRVLKHDLWLLAASFAIGLFFYYYKVELPFDLRQSFYSLPFFALGRFMKGRGMTDTGMDWHVLVAAGLVLIATELYCRLENFRFDILCQYLPPNAFWFYGGAAAAILLLLNVKYFSRRTLVNRILSSYGRHSLAIMALHMPYMAFLRNYIRRLHLADSASANVALSNSIAFVVLAVASYLLAVLIDNIVRLSKQKLTTVFSH